MKYKMLVLDLDDTLLRDDYTISARNKEVLIKAQKQGVRVVLASGRPTAAMMKFAYDLQLDQFGSHIVSFNGGNILDMQTHEILFQQCLSCEEIHDLFDFSKTHGVDIITYSDKGIISETSSEYIDFEIKLLEMAHFKVPSFKTEVQWSAVKCLMLGEPSYLKSVEQKLKIARPRLSVAISKPFFLEIMPQGIDKAASLAFLAKKLGIKQEEIIAVGNAENDLSMIEFAGLGVWVDNVTPELRHRANVIVASNNDDGVAEVVERYIF